MDDAGWVRRLRRAVGPAHEPTRAGAVDRASAPLQVAGEAGVGAGGAIGRAGVSLEMAPRRRDARAPLHQVGGHGHVRGHPIDRPEGPEVGGLAGRGFDGDGADIQAPEVADRDQHDHEHRQDQGELDHRLTGAVCPRA